MVRHPLCPAQCKPIAAGRSISIRRHSLKEKVMKFKSAGAVLTLALLFVIAAMSGCSKSANVSGEGHTYAQVAGDVQTRISSDPSLSGKQISINADKGVVTLTGTVDSDAEVTSALNDAQQAQGVKQVISRLAVQQASAAPEPEPEAQPEPQRHSSVASSRATTTHGRSRHSLPSSSSSYSNAQGTSTTTTASNSGS